MPQGTIAGSVLPIRRAEELIATLTGVLSVRIVANDSGAVDEIHVLTTEAVQPKQTVRNIESALMAQLGLRVNHRKISIATTMDAPRAADLPPASPTGAPGLSASMAGGVFPPGASITGGSVGSASASGATVIAPVADRMLADRRVLIFEDVEVRRSRTRGVLCRVTVSRGGEEYVGEAEGQESERSRIELAARATLLAIVTAAKTTPGGERSLSLEGSKLIDAFDREFIFVSISARVGREPVVLTGSCEIRESAETSAVLAVLDATNRWLHLDR